MKPPFPFKSSQRLNLRLSDIPSPLYVSKESTMPHKQSASDIPTSKPPKWSVLTCRNAKSKIVLKKKSLNTPKSDSSNRLAVKSKRTLTNLNKVDKPVEELVKSYEKQQAIIKERTKLTNMLKPCELLTQELVNLSETLSDQEFFLDNQME